MFEVGFYFFGVWGLKLNFTFTMLKYWLSLKCQIDYVLSMVIKLATPTKQVNVK